MTIKLYSHNICSECKDYRDCWIIPSDLNLEVYPGDCLNISVDTVNNTCKNCGNSNDGKILNVNQQQMEQNISAIKMILTNEVLKDKTDKELNRLERLFFIPQHSLLGGYTKCKQYFIAVISDK